jgi:alpha-N-arabinofuranosidase
MKTRFPVLASLLAFGLFMVTAIRAAEVEITVDTGKAGATISPYVYGQFIEHLGRCIHDGIWAEKLFDRKFLQELGKNWQTIKPKKAQADIFLDTAGAYAAAHAMTIWVRDAQGGRCGIRQDKIGVVKGKEYVGYAVLQNVTVPVPVEIRLVWGNGPEDSQSVVLDNVTGPYKRYPFRFRAGATTDAASLSVTLSAPGYLWVAGVSLMPADNIRGMRADTLALLRKLNAPIYRWPGGNFVSGYQWKDAVGDRDRRPPRWERAWNDVEDNDFGLDEFVAFCREINTEPLIVVNTGLGAVEDAAAEIEYANGSPKTRWGSVRAQNGHAGPYGVVWWGVGNEMFGNWQLGNVPVERYVLRHNAFAKAMRAADPSIKLVGVGAVGKWDDLIVPGCADHMELLSLHHYSERKLKIPFSPEDEAKYERNFLVYSDCIARGVRTMVGDLRKRQGKNDPAIDRLRLCIDEWGLVRDWDPKPDGPGVGSFECYYTIGDAVTVGRALHELLRAADLVGMANWPQTVNVIGAIKTSRTAAALDPVGHLLALYRATVHGRVIPVSVPPSSMVDAVAALDSAGGILSIGLINFAPKDTTTVRMRLSGATDLTSAGVWRIDGKTLDAINVPGQPEAVTTTKLPGPIVADAPLQLAPHSITVLTFGVRR